MSRVTGSVRTSGCEWLQYDYGTGLVLEKGRCSLLIGGTPLLPAPALRAALGTPLLWVKDETPGPIASNKDRATALVIEDGLRHGLKTIATASTGNTAVAMAFGAAVAGMRASIFVSIDFQEDKLALMTQAGAWVFQVPDGYAAAVDGNGRTTDDYDASAPVLPLQYHQFVPIWATTEQTEE
jgi:threonine synthase